MKLEYYGRREISACATYGRLQMKSFEAARCSSSRRRTAPAPAVHTYNPTILLFYYYQHASRPVGCLQGGWFHRPTAWQWNTARCFPSRTCSGWATWTLALLLPTSCRPPTRYSPAALWPTHSPPAPRPSLQTRPPLISDTNIFFPPSRVR